MVQKERKFKIIGVQTSRRVDDNREYEFISNSKKSTIIHLFESNNVNPNAAGKTLKFS